MDDDRAVPAHVDALPLPERASAYLAAQERLVRRLELPLP